MTATTEAEFSARAERHRRELHVHCYRMLGNFEEAEDLVQETLLRAWRNRASARRDDWFRAWLYKIATNACLDAIKRASAACPRWARSATCRGCSPTRTDCWRGAPPRRSRTRRSFARETIELTFLAVIQLLPPRQRAVLILRDVLDWPAQRRRRAARDRRRRGQQRAAARPRDDARSTLPQDRREDWRAPGGRRAPSARCCDSFIDAHERGDAEAALAAITDDIRITMPPHPWLYEGREAIAGAAGPRVRRTMGEWRLVPTAREPHARRRELPAQARRRHVPRVQARRAARARRPDRRDHDVRGLAVRGVRPAGHAALAKRVP